MRDRSYSVSFTVDRPVAEVFNAINNVRGWWSEEIEGSTDKVGDVWNYHYKDVHRCKLEVRELVPGKRVVWHVLDNHLNSTKDKSEWKDTDIIFEISKKGGKTEIRFTHEGLVPQYECYDICSNAWGSYINGSLKDLITSGKGHPNKKERKTK